MDDLLLMSGLIMGKPDGSAREDDVAQRTAYEKAMGASGSLQWKHSFDMRPQLTHIDEK
nr:hypothetical protein [Methylocapsa sp. S129]